MDGTKSLVMRYTVYKSVQIKNVFLIKSHNRNVIISKQAYAHNIVDIVKIKKYHNVASRKSCL